ncbi:tetratricopeptide repeat protein [Gloeothece verrucosa]|uniref:Tetratricopeptide domain protein n=1 Tax=Gloeothece verrucosa (strain PCC 7822) TaxID=497965 RepID=E0UIK0_GLOV7|nr:tetratricopeptide repeat protein [Gloeothece verrucosa]ADN12194.1 tetratricopeptide domain protein [Gloeothece verrucosa PCC 7822]
MSYLKPLSQIIPVIALVFTISISQETGNLANAAQSFEPSPLEIPIKDPLIPSLKRPLTPFEVRRLREALDELDTQAKAQLDAGNTDGAFEIWYRELRLRRFLGNLEEIQALGRVGAIAWDKSRTQDVKNISTRLVLVQQQAQQKGPLTPQLLDAFATAYQQLRKIDQSINIQQQILANARQQGDLPTQTKALTTIGDLYLSRFDYGKAAPIYEDLLKIAQSQQDSYQEGIYLKQLAEIYSETLQPANAVKIKEDLANNYLKNQQIQSIPDIKILIGQDYDTLNQPEKASQNFQEAFSLAWALQQYGAAGKALTQLGDLYRKYKQDDYALQIYGELIKVEQRSYNYYGLMNAYDKIGEIYLSKNNYSSAIAAFQQGLELARAISYNENYFMTKIDQANQKKNAPTSAPTPAPIPTPAPTSPQNR